MLHKPANLLAIDEVPYHLRYVTILCDPNNGVLMYYSSRRRIIPRPSLSCGMGNNCGWNG